MKYTITLALVAICQLVNAQFIYDFTSKQDSSEVYVNDELIGHTPLRFKYYWKTSQKNGKMVFRVGHDGFETWTDTLSKKPRNFTKSVSIELDHEIPDYTDLDIKNLCAFDKIVANFKDGSTIGYEKMKGEKRRKLTWNGDIKVGDEEFATSFYQILTKASIPTPYSENAELFKDQNYKPTKLPRFIIGAEVTKYQVILMEDPSKIAGDQVRITRFILNWNILDKATNEVVLTLPIPCETRYRESWHYTSQSLVETFNIGLLSLIKSPEFQSLIKQENKVHQPILADSPSKGIDIQRLDLTPYKSRSEMIKSTSKSCVTIITDNGHGSGAFITESGLILSAYHVVEGVNRLDIKLSNGVTLQGELISYDASDDICLIKAQGSGFSPLPIYEDENFDLGEEVITIGTPLDIKLGQSVTMGILSGKRLEEGKVRLQTDIAINPGNSGGPIINEKGQIVGIVQSKIAALEFEGIAFAIPMYKVIELLNLTILSK